MPYYNYYAIEPKAGTVVADLPLYGVQCDKMMSGIGNFTGTFRLKTGIHNDNTLIDFTKPGRYGVVIRRDEEPIWGGMIWSRTYASDAYTVQLTGQTFESIFDHVAMELNFVDTPSVGGGGEDTALWGVLLNNMQTQNSGAYNFGLTLAHPGALATTRYVDYLAAEYTLYSQPVRQLSEYDDGYGYTINLANVPGDGISKTFQLVRNSNAAAPTSGQFFDFPGTISSWWLNENASRGSVKTVGRASDLAEGATMPSYATTDSALTTEGYVPWHSVHMIEDVINDQDLINRTNQFARDLRMPIKGPTFQLGAQSVFAGWNDLGKKFSVAIANGDPRFPDGFTFTERLMGWQLTPETSDQQEIIRLVLEGDS